LEYELSYVYPAWLTPCGLETEKFNAYKFSFRKLTFKFLKKNI
jgi:hypothetical protein